MPEHIVLPEEFLLISPFSPSLQGSPPLPGGESENEMTVIGGRESRKERILILGRDDTATAPDASAAHRGFQHDNRITGLPRQSAAFVGMTNVGGLMAISPYKTTGGLVMTSPYTTAGFPLEFILSGANVRE